MVAPSSHELEPPAILGRFTTPINNKYVFNLYSKLTATQARAFELLGVKPDCTQ